MATAPDGSADLALPEFDGLFAVQSGVLSEVVDSKKKALLVSCPVDLFVCCLYVALFFCSAMSIVIYVFFFAQDLTTKAQFYTSSAKDAAQRILLDKSGYGISFCTLFVINSHALLLKLRYIFFTIFLSSFVPYRSSEWTSTDADAKDNVHWCTF